MSILTYKMNTVPDHTSEEITEELELDAAISKAETLMIGDFGCTIWDIKIDGNPFNYDYFPQSFEPQDDREPPEPCYE